MKIILLQDEKKLGKKGDIMYTKHVDAKKLTLQKEEVECVEWFDMEELDIALQPPRDQRFCVPMEGFRIAKRWWESRR